MAWTVPTTAKQTDGTAHSAVSYWVPFSTTLPKEVDWGRVLRRLKPGGHLAAVTNAKDYHRVATQVEDAGFEIRDQIVWLRSDFTTNMSVALARKPLEGTVVANVLKYGVGAIHIDANRVGTGGETLTTPQGDPGKPKGTVGGDFGITDAPVERFQQAQRESIERTNTMGRWPSNVVLSHHKDCRVTGTTEEEIPINTYEERGPFGDSQVGEGYATKVFTTTVTTYACVPECVTNQFPSSKAGKELGLRGTGGFWKDSFGLPCGPQYGDDGSASRFFTNATDWKNMYRYLINLITPPKGIVFDVIGDYSIGEIVTEEGFHYISGKESY